MHGDDDAVDGGGVEDVVVAGGVASSADVDCDAWMHYLCRCHQHVAQLRLHPSALLCPARRMTVGRRGAANAGANGAVMVVLNASAATATIAGADDAAIAHL